MRDNIKGGALTETTFFILLAVYKPNHGYGIMQLIKEETQGRLSLGAGTLYGAINTLCDKNWIVPYNPSKNSNKKEYVITELGKKIVNNEIKRFRQVTNAAEKIIGRI